MSATARKSRVLSILMIVLGPLVMLLSPVPGGIGFASMALTSFAIDLDGAAVDDQPPWLTEPPTSVTLFADASELPPAEACVVTSPSGASVPVSGKGLPGISHTDSGVSYEAFAQFEATEQGEHAVDCADANTEVFAQSGLAEASQTMNTLFVVSAVIFALGLALLVLGIVLLVRVNRHNRAVIPQADNART
ncbi:hypothetical protein [Agrococcus casei]|uniref:hypothetical protein n=1 Tax=Agrococcus casei TaxID=343512 RepID=UPI003F904383